MRYSSRMDKPVAVITGGAQGIGRAIARRFLVDGYAVVIADIDAGAGAETAGAYARLGPIRFMEGDVAREEHVSRIAADAVAAFGGINVLVNNAAIIRNGDLTGLSVDDWNRVLAVNLTGPWLCAKHMSPWLRLRKGVIINIASTRAFMSEPGTEAYSASKGGVVALTHALAASLAPDIRVNCISPGWIDTRNWKTRVSRDEPALTEADHRQHWAGRVGEPDDIAGLAAFLAADQSGFVTGSNFLVDGGMTRKMIYV